MNTNPALETLFLPFENDILSVAPGGKLLFLNARFHPQLESWQDISPVQPFKPHAEELERAGLAVQPEMKAQMVRTALVLLPKNAREAEYDLARAWESLEKGGVLIAAADNKAGGTRIAKMLETLSGKKVQSLSKNKARVGWVGKTSAGHAKTLQSWVDQGQVQKIMEGAFHSRPGLFSWDGLDKGTACLLPVLPQDLSGKGADFGCGYGAISRAVLEIPSVETLTCVDADARAVACCRTNMKKYKGRADFLWADLTTEQSQLDSLDFIVMNPPFHEGKTEDAVIGQKFIVTAALSLKPGGRLVMVANTHLPYEQLMGTLFTHVSKLYEGSGFKVYEAIK